MNFDYYYKNEAEQFNFYRIPKVLFTDKHFSKLSVEAKVLYGLSTAFMYTQKFRHVQRWCEIHTTSRRVHLIVQARLNQRESTKDTIPNFV